MSQVSIALILSWMFRNLIAGSRPYASDTSKFAMKRTPHHGMDTCVTHTHGTHMVHLFHGHKSNTFDTCYVINWYGRK